MENHLQTPTDRKDCLSEIRNIILRYTEQLLVGCGNSACREVLCDTGRRNLDSGRPIRKYTVRSARSIALAIASSPKPRLHLCKHSSREYRTTSALTQDPRDPASFAQLLSDTAAMRLLQPATSDTNLNRINRMLDPLFHQVPCISNQVASTILTDSLSWMVHQLPTGSYSQLWYAGNAIRAGSAYPSRRDGLPTGRHSGDWIEFLDAFEYQPYLRLLARICHAISKRTFLETFSRKALAENDVLHEARKVEILRGRQLLPLLSRKLRQTNVFQSKDSMAMSGIVLWLQKLLLKHWDGSLVIVPATIVSGALELLEALYSDFEIPAATFSLPAIWTRLEVIGVASSWINPETSGRHLLSFRYLFEPGPTGIYFRAINHLKMRETHSAAERAFALRRRVALHTLGFRSEGRIKYKEEHYLLLNVSRGDVLTDSYDQLWQRRRAELFRPLRVRLGEVEELEIGHDLGGVQIEFFNLVCKEVFAEQAQMFVADEKTGLSYFRPMSLQPLYMFELFGLLVSLAVYNGITLPISMPVIFYRHLLADPLLGGLNSPSQRSTTVPEVLGLIEHAWPQLCRSLKDIWEMDIEIEYAFPLEANGLRMTVRPSGSHSQRKGLEVITVVPNMQNGRPAVENHIANTSAIATIEDSVPVPIDIETISEAWPGWYLKPCTEEPAVVHTNNKADYVRDYVDWLLFESVAPQWNAFQRGFEKVVDRHSLSLFTAESLKSYLEGSTRLNLSDLRATTQYDGYEAKSKYIQSFWQIVGSWSEEKQKQLLKFVTAVERVPAGGESNITFVIKRTIPASAGYLPTSSTCFGTLQLPRYESAEVLEQKLSLAIKYGLEGFGSG